MKRKREIFLVFLVMVGFLAVHSLWGGEQIYKQKNLVKKPILVKITRSFNLHSAEKKISGIVSIAHNGQPQSNWKVTGAGYPMSYSGDYYSMGKRPFSVQPGKLVKVIMTPPFSGWQQNPIPIVATSSICQITKVTSPANGARVNLSSTIGNLKISWTNVTKGTETFYLYEVVYGGSTKKIFEKSLGLGVTSVEVPVLLLKPRTRYKITLVQYCNTFKFNMKVASGSYLDLMIWVDSFFSTI